jgi:hypothetical protein
MEQGKSFFYEHVRFLRQNEIIKGYMAKAGSLFMIYRYGTRTMLGNDNAARCKYVYRKKRRNRNSSKNHAKRQRSPMNQYAAGYLPL